MTLWIEIKASQPIKLVAFIFWNQNDLKIKNLCETNGNVEVLVY